jgi:hypothetical protein
MGNPAGNKRGYVFGGDAEQRQRAAEACEERTKFLQNAWRNPAAAAERNETQLEAWRKPCARPVATSLPFFVRLLRGLNRSERDRARLRRSMTLPHLARI